VALPSALEEPKGPPLEAWKGKEIHLLFSYVYATQYILALLVLRGEKRNLVKSTDGKKFCSCFDFYLVITVFG
jgi:hypothetical protein